jgi:hypothetical protein
MTAPATIQIVTDRLPGHDPATFIEVEDQDGKSISIGKWVERPDGTAALVIELPESSGAQGAPHTCP